MIAPLVLFAALAGPPQDAPPPCMADIRWVNDTQLNVSRSGPPHPLTLFTAVGGDSPCVPATIVLSMVYFDATDDVVCSGVIEQSIPLRTPVQYTHLELRPGNLFEVVRWRNGPRPTSLQWDRLSCLAPDGQGEIQPGEFHRASTVRVHATIRPRSSGVASAELRIVLQP